MIWIAGLACRVPYQHQTAVGCQAPFTEAGKHHELIAALSRITVTVGGEDFREFMRKGATQRSTVHAYLDLFCYQPPANRFPLLLLPSYPILPFPPPLSFLPSSPIALSNTN